MLKNIVLLLVALAIVVSANPVGDAPAVTPRPLGFDVNKSRTTDGFDTLAAALDSSTLVTNWSPSPKNAQWFLSHSEFRGTGADSVDVEVLLDCKDNLGNLLHRQAIDTLTDSTFEYIYVPINDPYQGTLYDIKLRGITGNGTQLIINKFYLWARRVFTDTEKGR